jgi:hypothetical protein
LVKLRRNVKMRFITNLPMYPESCVCAIDTPKCKEKFWRNVLRPGCIIGPPQDIPGGYDFDGKFLPAISGEELRHRGLISVYYP